MRELLESMGLSEKEARMYLSLLQSGTRATSFLARRCGLNRGTGYVVLHSLWAKGFALKSVKQNLQYFTAVEPRHLPDLLEAKQRDLEQVKLRLQQSMGDFAALLNPSTTKPKIQFFDGVEGARRVLLGTLSSKDKVLRAFLSIADIADAVGGDFFDHYTTQRVKKGFTLHALRTREKDKLAMERSNIFAKRFAPSVAQRRYIRYLSEDLAFPMTMYLYDHTIAAISSASERFALLIESREMAEMQKKIFMLLWNATPAGKR